MSFFQRIDGSSGLITACVRINCALGARQYRQLETNAFNRWWNHGMSEYGKQTIVKPWTTTWSVPILHWTHLNCRLPMGTRMRLSSCTEADYWELESDWGYDELRDAGTEPCWDDDWVDRSAWDDGVSGIEISLKYRRMSTSQQQYCTTQSNLATVYKEMTVNWPTEIQRCFRIKAVPTVGEKFGKAMEQMHLKRNGGVQ